jgi:phosphatidylglycerophosphatase GEP4
MPDIRTFNLSGTLGALSVIFRPSQCLPQAVVRNFNELPIPLSQAFAHHRPEGTVNIRAVVLDKDDCFARPRETEVAAENKVRA